MKAEQIDDLLRMVELFLLARKPMSVDRWRRLSDGFDAGRAAEGSFSALLAKLFAIGMFDVTRRVREREEEYARRGRS